MKKSRINNRGLVYVLFLILTVVSLVLLAELLSHKSPHGINQAACIYEQPQDSVDVLFLGTSHVHCGVNTAILWEEYGIPAYDYSGAEQPLWMTYHYLQEAYKKQSPKVVVLDLYAPARFKEDYQYEWADENIYGMKFSLNKLKMLAISLENEYFFHYFPSFLNSHYRYKELDEELYHESFWLGKDKIEFKGYTPYWKRTEQVRHAISVDSSMRTDGALTKKSKYYLEKIIELAKKQGSTLLFMVAPYMETNEDRLTYLEIGDIAEKNNIVMINYNEYFDAMGLDVSNDFHDESHLNYWGSCKFTRFLGEYLGSICENRKNKGDLYESWEKHVEDIVEEYAIYGMN